MCKPSALGNEHHFHKLNMAEQCIGNNNQWSDMYLVAMQISIQSEVYHTMVNS